jgi:hypothetical protein
LTDEKKLLKMSALRSINMPKFDELSVKRVYPLIQRDQELMMYFPDRYPKGRTADRE